MRGFPFVGAGVRGARRALRALRLQADRERCTACGSCTRACPMSLPVQELVAAGRLERAECILCGSCVSACPSSVIRYSLGAGR